MVKLFIVKHVYLVLVCIIILIIVFGFYKEKQINYVFNPNLSIIKNNWKGNVLINGEFHNDTVQETRSIWNAIKWKLSPNPQQKEKDLDNLELPTFYFGDFSKEESNIIWLGHSTFLITINGVSLITDPCFFDLPVAKRKIPVPCNINKLKPIDYLLISHDHRDHFDKKSLNVITTNNPGIEALLPLNAGRLFNTKELKPIVKQEAGWFQEYKLKEDLRIIFLPARHWGKRSIFDYNKTLWGSFLIISDHTKVFFSGDTAYDPIIFKEIQSIFGNIDICLLPIGAYSPRSMMQTSHTTPEEAFKIFNDLEGGTFIPMHYGTYDLSDEPMGEPIRRIKMCFDDDSGKLKILNAGEKFIIKN